MASKKYASYRPVTILRLGGIYYRGGGLPEGRLAGTGRWTGGGVSCSPDCGARGEGPHYVGAMRSM